MKMATFSMCRLKELLCFTLLFQLGASTVFLNRAKDGVAVCKGTTAPNITCTTTTPDGFLTWRNSSGAGFAFGESTSGNTGTLGSMIMTLNSIEHVSNAVVYTSTASENMIQNTTIQCSDGGEPQSINITVKNPSSPSWAHSPCRFSQGSVRLSWNAPSVASECCDHYTVQLSTGSVDVADTSVTVPIEQDKAMTATVHCVDGSGKMVTKTEEIFINTTVVIERIMIEQNRCDDTYRIVWATSPPSEGVCTPPITMSTITCTTSSPHQSSNNTGSMICSVPANEVLNATATITNAAGFNTSQSASTGCVCNQLLSSEVVAIIMGLLVLLLLLAVVCIALVVCAVLTCIRLLPHGIKFPKWSARSGRYPITCGCNCME